MSKYPYYTEPDHQQGAITTGVPGARDSGTLSTTGQLKVDCVDKIALLEARVHPFMTMLTQVGSDMSGNTWKGLGLPKAVAGSPEFSWIEDRYAGKYAKIGSVTSGTTGDVVLEVTGAGSSSGYIFTVGDVVKNARTGENFIITSIESATSIKSLSASRAFGTTAAATPAAGDSLFIIGNASEEGVGARNVNTTKVSKQSNYTQIFRSTVAVTGTEAACDTYGENDLTYQRKKIGIQHAKDIEKAFIFGEKKATTGTYGHPKRATGGVLEFILSGGSYIQDQGGPLTAPDLNIFLREGFAHGNGRKVLMCGGVVISAINEIARGQLTDASLSGTTYGIEVSSWKSAWGLVDIVFNPFLVGDYAGYAFLLDPESFRYRYMKGRDTQLKLNVQAPDADAEIDEYFSEVGLERVNAPLNALLKGCTD